ncbi:type 1 glutamine amidotransferase [Amycolatopsis sp. NPDC051903]|uniref:type 1 glutamine amidotransferase n=1 Tax=Amycolatopsis sp. NPDC051903 TaxID=3363936 RepID=UPI0037B3B76A
MANRALILVHDPAPGRRERVPGAIAPALSTRDIKHEVVSLVAEDAPDPADHDLLVVMGSSESAADDAVPWLAKELAFVRAVVERGVPTLGVCFGGQLLARVLGGSVGRAALPEFGFTTVETDDAELVPAGPWLQFHSDAFVPPPGTELARNASGSQAFATGKVLGLQFHPEMTADTFASWRERWAAAGWAPGSEVDVERLRADIAAGEARGLELCDRLVGAFCAATLAG